MLIFINECFQMYSTQIWSIAYSEILIWCPMLKSKTKCKTLIKSYLTTTTTTTTTRWSSRKRIIIKEDIWLTLTTNVYCRMHLVSFSVSWRVTKFEKKIRDSVCCLSFLSFYNFKTMSTHAKLKLTLNLLSQQFKLSAIL